MKEESPSMSEFLTTSKHNEELDAMVKAAADHTWTIDEILGLALETKDYINEFSARELDTLILDMTYVLAFEKRNDRNGKHWKHITLDCETQALICKLAEFEMCLNRLEERRLEMTLTAAAERERLEKRKRAVLTRGWRRVERLGRRLSRRVYEWKQVSRF